MTARHRFRDFLCGLQALCAGVGLAGAPLLEETRLTGGVLQDAMTANVAYLLAISEQDEMLYGFRELAGITNPPGRKTGWEGQYPSHAAQFLMGAGNTLRWREEPALRQNVDRLIEGIKACQTSAGVLLVPGVGPSLKGQWGYSMQMFAHGMFAAGQAGNRDAYPLLAAAHRHYAALLRKMPAGFALATDLNYQGHIASLLNFFSPAGSREDVPFAEQVFVSKPWMRALTAKEPEAIWKNSPKWPHCYEIIAFEAYLDHYLATGDGQYLEAASGAWELVRDSWRDVGGTIAISEHQVFPPKCYPLKPERHAGELCGTVFWVRLNRRFQKIFPEDERYASEIEQAIFNAALGGLDPQGQGFHYNMVLEGQKRQGQGFAQGPVPSQRHTCCEGNGTWLCGNLPEYLFSCEAEGVRVHLYQPSETVWRKGGEPPVRVTVQTRFPADGQVTVRVAAGKPARMALRLRMPGWCAEAVPVTVNGRETAIGKPGSYLTLDRVWSDADTVAFRLPLTFRAHAYEGEATVPEGSRYAVFYGPLLLACVGSPELSLPVRLALDPKDLAAGLSADAREPSLFHIRGDTRHVFIPYWKVGHAQPFSCYPVLTAKP